MRPPAERSQLERLIHETWRHREQHGVTHNAWECPFVLAVWNERTEVQRHV